TAFPGGCAHANPAPGRSSVASPPTSPSGRADRHSACPDGPPATRSASPSPPRTAFPPVAPRPSPPHRLLATRPLPARRRRAVLGTLGPTSLHTSLAKLQSCTAPDTPGTLQRSATARTRPGSPISELENKSLFAICKRSILPHAAPAPPCRSAGLSTVT